MMVVRKRQGEFDAYIYSNDDLPFSSCWVHHMTPIFPFLDSSRVALHKPLLLGVDEERQDSKPHDLNIHQDGFPTITTVDGRFPGAAGSLSCLQRTNCRKYPNTLEKKFTQIPLTKV